MAGYWSGLEENGRRHTWYYRDSSPRRNKPTRRQQSRYGDHCDLTDHKDLNRCASGVIELEDLEEDTTKPKVEGAKVMAGRRTKGRNLARCKPGDIGCIATEVGSQSSVARSEKYEHRSTE